MGSNVSNFKIDIMKMINPIQSRDQFEAQKMMYVDIFGICYTFEDENGYRWNLPPDKVVVIQKSIVHFPKERSFWISIQKAESSLFSRRNAYKGKVILGYSICLRLFGKDIL